MEIFKGAANRPFSHTFDGLPEETHSSNSEQWLQC